MKTLTENQSKLLDIAFDKFGATATTRQISSLAESMGEPFPHFMLKGEYRVKRGLYDLNAQIVPITKAPVKKSAAPAAAKQNMNMETKYEDGPFVQHIMIYRKCNEIFQQLLFYIFENVLK